MVFLICPADKWGESAESALHNKSPGTLVNSNSFSASVAVFGEHAVEAAEAVRPALSHDVALAAQVAVALEAGEVLHVPGAGLGLGALVREDDLKEGSERDLLGMTYGPAASVPADGPTAARLASPRDIRAAHHAPLLLTIFLLLPPCYLVTGRAPGLGRLRMVSTTEQLLVLVEVDEVDEELLAHGAGEAGGVPDPGGASSAGAHADVSSQDAVSALREQGSDKKKRERGIRWK